MVPDWDSLPTEELDYILHFSNDEEELEKLAHQICYTDVKGKFPLKEAATRNLMAIAKDLRQAGKRIENLDNGQVRNDDFDSYDAYIKFFVDQTLNLIRLTRKGMEHREALCRHAPYAPWLNRSISTLAADVNRYKDCTDDDLYKRVLEAHEEIDQEAMKTDEKYKEPRDRARVGGKLTVYALKSLILKNVRELKIDHRQGFSSWDEVAEFVKNAKIHMIMCYHPAGMDRILALKVLLAKKGNLVEALTADIPNMFAKSEQELTLLNLIKRTKEQDAEFGRIRVEYTSTMEGKEMELNAARGEKEKHLKEGSESLSMSRKLAVEITDLEKQLADAEKKAASDREDDMKKLGSGIVEVPEDDDEVETLKFDPRKEEGVMNEGGCEKQEEVADAEKKASDVGVAEGRLEDELETLKFDPEKEEGVIGEVSEKQEEAWKKLLAEIGELETQKRDLEDEIKRLDGEKVGLRKASDGRNAEKRSWETKEREWEARWETKEREWEAQRRKWAEAEESWERERRSFARKHGSWDLVKQLEEYEFHFQKMLMRRREAEDEWFRQEIAKLRSRLGLAPNYCSNCAKPIFECTTCTASTELHEPVASPPTQPTGQSESGGE